MSTSTSDALADLIDAFPRQKNEMTRNTFRIYVDDLSDIPEDALIAAIRSLRRTCRFLPSISEIRESAAEYLLRLPTETDALAQVEQKVMARGESYAPLHPLVNEALKLVGGSYAWRTTDEPGVIRGQFAKAYREIRSKALREVQVGKLELPPARPQLPASP